MAAAAANLSRGALATIVEGGEGAEGLKPILQVTDCRPLHHSSAERYRMMLSDGLVQQQAMLATQMNEIVKSGALQKGSIIRMTEYVCNTIQDRRIIIIIGLDVLSGETGAIGAENNFEPSSGTLQNQVMAPPQSFGVEQPVPAAANPLAYGSSYSYGPAAGQSLKRDASLNPCGAPYGRNTSNASSVNLGFGQGDGAFNNPPSSIVNQNQRAPNPVIGAGYRPPGNTYGRAGQPSYQQPPSLYSNRGPIAKNEAAPRIVPIASLNPYQGRWTIKARVTAKGELRRYNNPRGEGKVFSFDLLDSDGGEIRVTCFNAVADQFYDMIEAGKVYSISKGTLKPAQKNFNHLNNEYEITLDSTSTIVPCYDDDTTIPRQQFNFKSIDQIEGLENKSMLDVIGIVTAVYPATTIMTKNGSEAFKRTLQLKDMSGRSVELTLWGNFCNNEGQQLQAMCDSGLSPVLAVKAVKVNEFSGKSVGTISTSQLFIDPDSPEALRLKEWYEREGKNIAAVSISRDSSSMGRADTRKTVTQIKDEGLGRSEKADWIHVKATVSFIKVDNFCYTACPLMIGDRKCQKKVSNNGDGTWQCDRCDKNVPECDYRYILQCQIQDHTGMTWVTAFHECGEEMMGLSAKDLYLLKHEEQDDMKFAEVFRKVLLNQFLFKLRVKEDTYNDETRIKIDVVKAERVNPSTESRYLLGLIQKLSTEDSSAVPQMHGAFASDSRTANVGYAHPVTSNFGSSGGNGYGVAQANQIGQNMNDYGGHGIKKEQLFCNNCGSSGHDFQNCPRAMDRQAPSVGGGFSNRSSATAMGGNTSSNICFKCQQPGHWARDCPGAGAGPSAYGGSSKTGSYSKQYVGGY